MAATLMLVALGGAAVAQKMIILNFRESPLPQVVEFYRDLTGTNVIVELAVYPTITLATTNRLNEAQTIALIETYCASNGILFTHSSTGVVISIDPTRAALAPKPSVTYRRVSYAERRATNQPDANLQKALAEYQLEVIRRGLPPLLEPELIVTNAP
jgi:type II secretory pathway component GspD/PulD (secretin)